MSFISKARISARTPCRRIRSWSSKGTRNASAFWRYSFIGLFSRSFIRFFNHFCPCPFVHLLTSVPFHSFICLLVHSLIHYSPQTKFAKIMFSQVSGLFTGGVSVRKTPVQFRAGGTHPIVMHSCLFWHSFIYSGVCVFINWSFNWTFTFGEGE